MIGVVHTGAFSASDANSKKRSTPYSLGPATKAGDLISGKTENVILDTQFIDALVKATSLGPWMSVIVRNNQKVGILYHSILKSKSSANSVIQGLQSKGIQVLGSSNEEEDSISSAGEIMKDAYAKVKADIATSKANCKGICSKDITPTLERTIVIDRSQTDLALACAAHVKGSAFITADQVFAAHFGKEAARRGVRIYVIPASWAALRQN